VIYELVEGEGWIQVNFTDGRDIEQTGNQLDGQLSAEIFSRSGRIEKIRVGISPGVLCEDQPDPVT
jgi:hypothetical protein